MSEEILWRDIGGELNRSVAISAQGRLRTTYTGRDCPVCQRSTGS